MEEWANLQHKGFRKNPLGNVKGRGKSDAKGSQSRDANIVGKEGGQGGRWKSGAFINYVWRGRENNWRESRDVLKMVLN